MIKLILLLSLFISLIVPVEGHGTLTTPKPRTKGTNQRTVPCSDENEDDEPVNIVGGSPTTIKWDITADHGGTVDLNIFYNGTKVSNETQFINLVSDLENKLERYTLTLNETCEKCLFQWVWYPASEPTPYIGCSNIRIIGPPELLTIQFNDDLETFDVEKFKRAISVLAQVPISRVVVEEIKAPAVTVEYRIEYDEDMDTNSSADAVRLLKAELQKSGVTTLRALYELNFETESSEDDSPGAGGIIGSIIVILLVVAAVCLVVFVGFMVVFKIKDPLFQMTSGKDIKYKFSGLKHGNLNG